MSVEHLKLFCMNAIAALIVVLALIILLALNGCALLGGDGLRLDVETPDKTVSLDVDYQIENGLWLKRGESGEYEIELGSATTKDAEMGIVVELLRMMQTMMSAGYPMPVPTPPDNSDG